MSERYIDFVTNPYAATAIGICAVVGAYKILRATISLTGTCNRHVFRRTYDMHKRYAKEDSWVVVTGGSDGIGLEICHQMAAKGFNVCMISRSQTKMDEKLKEFEKYNIKTRTIVFDFAEFCHLSDYKTKIGDTLKDIDIAMLFLNAGFAQHGAFVDISDNDVQKMTSVNTLQPIYTAKVLVDQMLARNHRAAIVITSSGAAELPLAGVLTYCCTKTFASYLGRGLNHELKGKIDCLSWQPGETATKMIGKQDQAGGNVLSCEVAVKGMLRDLGKESYSFGHAKHASGATALTAMPESLVNKMVFPLMQKDHAKLVAEGKADKKIPDAGEN